MGVHLSQEIQDRLEQQREKGGFSSVDEVVAAALDLLDQYEAKRAELQREIDLGVRDIEAGRVSDGPFSALIPELEAEFATKHKQRVR
jgi:putative addiction module CopG family antidote